LALLTGGFRAVTGSIGNLHKENYSIRTPNATVGIRGTDHETVFVPRSPQGQTTIVEPGTYNHVISGATILKSEQGKLLIKPNQTGFAALGGASPILMNRPLPIFGNQNASPEARENQHGDMGDAGKGMRENNSFSDSTSETGQHSGIPMSGTEQNNLTQTEHVANSNVDLSTLEKDSSPAAQGSAVTGTHLAMGLQVTGSAQAGNPGQNIFVDNNVPTSYANDATGFNYLAHDAPPIQSGTSQVDNVNVTWGIYAGGIAFDTSGKSIPINYHPFAFADAGATSPAVVSQIGGTATFTNMAGSTQPVTESGNIGGSATLNVGMNLGAGTLTSYNLAVTDANSRSWTGNLVNGTPVPLAAFANGTPLTVTCGACSGAASGSAAGMLIGPNAKGLISSYVLSTTTGQAVAGAAVMSRP
jgi:hypothetical protein